MSLIENCRVRRVRVDEGTEWVFLELVTADGIVGTGEALLGGREPLLASALHEAGASLVGIDALRALVPVSTLADDDATGLLEATVRSTIDQCLWDLRARIADVPLYRLLGPVRRDRIELYANINRGTRDRSPDGFAHRASQAAGAGFDAVKIAPFDGVTRQTLHSAAGRQALQKGIDRILAVRASIGDERTLMVDCHCRLNLSAALRVLDATHGARLDWFEDVLPYHDLDGWRRLKSGSRVPLIGGESARGIRDLVPFLEAGIWDVVMPDVRFFGGISELMALAPLAEQYQVSFAPHNPRGPIGTLASAHAMASCSTFLKLEFQFAECDWREALTGYAERIEFGQLVLTEAPGLGVALVDDVVAAHTPSVEYP